eukprot:2744100-Rhodomonas_salina.1
MSTHPPLANSAAAAIPNPQPSTASTLPCTGGSPTCLLQDDYLNCFKIKVSKKQFFEVHVNAKFDESHLAACFLSVAKDKNLRSATFEWLNDKKLLVKCPDTVRLNSLINALRTNEARAIVTVKEVKEYTSSDADYLREFNTEIPAVRYYYLHVNNPFDEGLLATCFKDVSDNETLRSAKFEWLDTEKLLVKCSGTVRRNALVKALRTDEARAIASVYSIQDAGLDNRQASKEYRAAAGRVLTPE